MTILMYHKVSLTSPTMWWVTVDEFYRQMLELKSRKIVYLDDYNPDDPEQVVISFDGVYKNVLEYAAPILSEFNYPFELFISSDYIGKNNSFDQFEPLADFASLNDLKLLVEMNGRLQWHTKSHPDLTQEKKISNILFELDISFECQNIDPKGFNWFAYPYGNFNQIVVEEVKKRFVGALSCHQGNDTDIFCLNRTTVTNKTTFSRASIAVIIASYNYGLFLVEAIESVLRQTRMPNEILITDDASDDNTYEIAEFYKNKYPNLIKINRNKHNLGIVKHFNKAVNLTSADYITILGADNKYRSDFLEKTSLILDRHSDVAIAYSDFALFGSRAKLVYDSNLLDRRGSIKGDTFYVINFPEFDKNTKQNLLNQGNFIHGSSMFKRQAFNEVGGYVEQATVPEDYSLFARIVKLGWNAKRVPFPILEYRQHSKSQANIRLTTFAELQFYKQLAKNLHYELQQLKSHFHTSKPESAHKTHIPTTDFKFDSIDLNFIVFPDWQQSKELLYKELIILIKSIIKHPDKHKITLLIDSSNISEENANFIISDILLNIFKQEKLEVGEELAITLINDFTPTDWKSLLPKITVRIALNIDHKSAILRRKAENIPTCPLTNINDIQAASFNGSKIYLKLKSKHDFINKIFDNLEKYRKEPWNLSLLYELFDLRKQMAYFWLQLEENLLEITYCSQVGEAHKSFLKSEIKYQALTESEHNFAEALAQFPQEFEQPKAIQYLLASTLYSRADQLSLQHDLSHIPHWFLKDYLQFLFSSPVHFNELGEVDNYYKYMQEWLDYLHKSIFNNLDSSLWRKVVNIFTRIANFIPAYFNEANLKDIYIKRAEILELFLKNNRCEVDYEFPARPVNRKKIRLGILAAHFTPGSETFAYLPVYEYLSRDFEVVLYSLKQTGHPLEEYCRSCANSFKLLPQNLSEQVNTIRADDLDILFIATNVTAVTNQICLLASHRLARIQATSGGSVVTTGMRHMDYYISGTLTDPSPTAQEQYKEKLVKLEGTAHCFSYGCESEKATAEVDRESLGISESAVVFISGANFYKIVPELIHTWAKIIAEVPDSVLVLLPFGPNWSNAYPKQAFEKHLQNIFSQYEISTERLLILDPQPVPNREDVKEYFKIADIYLDSYPFSGTTSLIEPLQVNLPVISRQGDTFRSAMGAAMVRSLDIPDLVADSEETYIQLAVELGTNPELRKQKSDRIFQKMQQTPSFLDSRSYSAQMGALFQQLFQKYQTDTLANQLRLRDINLVVFPDWQQSEESLYQDFANVLKTMSGNSDKSRMTLLIDTDGIDGEDANLLFSGVAMNLLMEEAVDIADELEVALLDDLTEDEWELLLSLVQGRISLDNENQNAIAKAKAESLTIYS